MEVERGRPVRLELVARRQRHVMEDGKALGDGAVGVGVGIAHDEPLGIELGSTDAGEDLALADSPACDPGLCAPGLALPGAPMDVETVDEIG
jgi:hypothetical protein